MPGYDDPVMTTVITTIRDNVLAVLPDLNPGEIRPDRSLQDLGCNSIDRADVVTMSLDDLGIVAPVTEFSSVGDIGTLAGLLRRHL